MTAEGLGEGHAVRTQADYIDGPAGKLFVVRFRPHTDPETRRAVLCLPPFAEEMNKSRRMLALQGRKLAQHGRTFVLPDLSGTGDSEGEFGEATWDSWRRDIKFVVDWLRSQNFDRVDVLSLRSGIFLGAGVPVEWGGESTRTVLWSPVVRGTGMLDLLFRTMLIRNVSDARVRSVADIRESLFKAGGMEIAGYWLSEPLLRSIDELEIDQLKFAPDSRILWADISPALVDRVPRKTEKILDAWRPEYSGVEYVRIAGPQFWLGPEIDVVPELIDKTTDFFTAV